MNMIWLVVGVSGVGIAAVFAMHHVEKSCVRGVMYAAAIGVLYACIAAKSVDAMIRSAVAEHGIAMLRDR